MTLTQIVFTLLLISLSSHLTFVIAAEIELSENDIEWCHELHPQYEISSLEWFLENYHYTIEARVCASLYEDPIWDYEGDDRIDKLLERSKYYIELEILESQEEAKSGITDPTPAQIPTWIKNNAGWWAEGLISDNDFVSGIQWLVQNNIIQITYDEPSEGEAAITIPSWIKTNARFWVENKITDADFVIGIEWLINNGIIRV
jgi:hypothetical protein